MDKVHKKPLSAYINREIIIISIVETFFVYDYEVLLMIFYTFLLLL